MGSRQGRNLIILVLLALVTGCAAQYERLSPGQAVDLRAQFAAGSASLECDLACSGRWGYAREQAKSFYDNRTWDALAMLVIRIGFPDDLAWYYLGRSAEELGHLEAARTYYARSNAVQRSEKCGFFINTCDGIKLPRMADQGRSRIDTALNEQQAEAARKRRAAAEGTRQEEVRRRAATATENESRGAAAPSDADAPYYCYDPGRQVMYEVRRRCLPGERALSKAEFEAGITDGDARKEEVQHSAAEEATGKPPRIAALSGELIGTDVVAEIMNDGVHLRALPERGAEAVKELRRGRQVHVTGALPNGWLLIAEEGEPVGWIFKTAVAAEALAAVAPGGGAPRPANQPAAVAVADPELEPLDAPFRVRSAANVRAAPAVTAARVGGLSTGERVTALGKVRDGNWYLVERDGERMGFVFGPLLQRVGAAQENRDAVAVIVGNKSYRGDVPAVDYAYNDAEAMKRYVIDVLGYRKGNIIDLRDATKGEIEIVFGTERNHRGQLFDFIRAGESDVTVFYSGHGVPGLQDKRGYLLPVDGDPNRAEISGFSLDVLLGNLAKLPARSIQVFLDACFSGNSARGMLIQAASGIGISPALPDAAANFLMLTAASGDQVASWDRDARHGLFTKHLLQALDGAADGEEYGDGDGTVTLNEVKTFLDREMTFQARRRFGREQNATMIGSGDTVLTRL